MTLIVHQPYNMFRSGQVQGETVEEFAAGKQAANSLTGAVGQPEVKQTPAPVVQNTQVQMKEKTQPVLDGDPSTAGADYLNSLYTSPEQEEKLRKASVMNQRILAVGDAIRHIGNLVHTAKGAPSQQFNNPVLEEQARYERGKALRDRANQQFYSYQQQKAAQDAVARRWEAEQKQKAAQWDANFKYNATRDAALLAERARQHNENIAYRKQNDEANRKQREEQHKEKGRKQATSSSNKVTRGMDEYTVTKSTVYNYDRVGKKTGSTTTEKRTVNTNQQPAQTTRKTIGLKGQGNTGKTIGLKK